MKCSLISNEDNVCWQQHLKDSRLPLWCVCGCPAAPVWSSATCCLGRTSWSRPNTSGHRTRTLSGSSPSPRSQHPQTCGQSGNSSHHTLKMWPGDRKLILKRGSTHTSRVDDDDDGGLSVSCDPPGGGWAKCIFLFTSCYSRKVPVGVQVLGHLLPETLERPAETESMFIYKTRLQDHSATKYTA